MSLYARRRRRRLSFAAFVFIRVVGIRDFFLCLLRRRRSVLLRAFFNLLLLHTYYSASKNTLKP
jgi:hypothetical protein